MYMLSKKFHVCLQPILSCLQILFKLKCLQRMCRLIDALMFKKAQKQVAPLILVNVTNKYSLSKHLC